MRTRPNRASNAIDVERTASCTDAFRVDNRLSAIPRPANASTKPDTTNKGRQRSGRSSEVPSSTGSKGSTQGEAMVSMPASKAMGVLIRSMRQVLWKEAPLHPRRVSGLCRFCVFFPGLCICRRGVHSTTHLRRRPAL
ncbi:hypothetical protein D3C73_1029950 [compost metagenome]